MKKIAILGALALSAPALAMDANGLYMGIYTGMGSINAELTESAASTELGNNGVSFGGFMGYEMDLGHGFAALEADLNMTSIEIKRSAASAKLNADRGISYGMSMLAGMPLSDHFDVYARFGFTITEFEAVTDAKTYDTDELGYVFGVGSRFALEDNIHLRMDYRYTYYDSFKFAYN